MNLVFELIDELNVRILDKDNGRIIGRIFTPSGTTRDKKDAIQICGFSRAFELWGCGVLGDNKKEATQDIQLLFKDFKIERYNHFEINQSGEKKPYINAEKISILDKKGCDKCLHFRDKRGNCKCDELKIHRTFKDLEKWEKRKANYNAKIMVIEKLKEYEQN